MSEQKSWSLRPAVTLGLRSAACALVLARPPDSLRLRPAVLGVLGDVEAVAERRATVLRDDLVRLGRYDEANTRQRLRNTFVVDHTSIVLVDGELVGSVAVRPAADGDWLEHFYLAQSCRGIGIGTAILGDVIERCDRAGQDVRLNVLSGSRAQSLYARHGFVVERQDPIDVFMVRRHETMPPPSPRDQ